jgi:LCP family protein required for cell wall assembly
VTERGKRRLRRAAQGAIAFVLVLVVAVAGTYVYINGNFHIDPLHIDGPRPEATQSLDVLLIGSDTREGDSAEFQGTGADAVGGARSDTTVLVHLARGAKKALLVSFPRDLWVDLPSCQRPGRSPSTPVRGRFNRAFTIGGASCTAKVVEQLTDIRVDDYVQVDFASFRTIVDALGGVPFCTPVPLSDPFVPRRGTTPGHGTGLDLPAGTTTLDGDTALALVRARYGIGDGSDLGRIQRQQQFLGAVVRRATSTKLLLNPPRLFRFLDTASKSVTTGGMKLGGLRDLAGRLKGLDPGKVTFVTVPTTVRSDGATLALAEPAATSLFASMREESAPVPGGERTPAPATVSVPPGAVRVRVLNGTGETGLARRAADELAGLGFVVVDVADADSHDYVDTVVRRGPTKRESSATLAAAVPGSTQQLDGSLTRTLELVIGRDYSGTRPVRYVAPASGPPPVTAADDPCD